MPSKIDWCDETVNPLGWGCWGPGGTPAMPQSCSYCYAKAFAKRGLRDCQLCREFVPHWHPEAIDKVYSWKKPKRIFWQSMGDLFHPLTPKWQILTIVLGVVKATPWHTHIFLTKNPAGYLDSDCNPWPKNCYLGATATSTEEFTKAVILLSEVNAKVKFISLEPILGFIVPARPEPVDWLILGALTGQRVDVWLGGATRTTVQVFRQWARSRRVPLFEKDNLRPYVEGELSREFPCTD